MCGRERKSNAIAKETNEKIDVCAYGSCWRLRRKGNKKLKDWTKSSTRELLAVCEATAKNDADVQVSWVSTQAQCFGVKQKKTIHWLSRSVLCWVQLFYFFFNSNTSVFMHTTEKGETKLNNSAETSRFYLLS